MSINELESKETNVLEDEKKVVQDKNENLEEEILDEYMEDISDEDFSGFDDNRLLSESEKCLAEGRNLYNRNQFEEASLKFQRGLKMRIHKFGELALESASYYFWYGRSLLGIVQQNTSILANDVNTTESNASTTETPAIESSKNSPSAVETSENTPAVVESSEAAPVEDIADDKQLAWENIEIARVIWSGEENNNKAKDDLATCYGVCGDIKLENDMYEEAMEEFIKAAKLHEELEGTTSRHAAGDYVSAAAAASYCYKTEAAYEFYLQALTNLDGYLRNLMNLEVDQDEEDLVLVEESAVKEWLEKNQDDAKRSEVEEIFSFCLDISERLDSIATEAENQEQQVNPEDLAAIVQNLIAQQVQEQTGFDTNEMEEEEMPVNDLGTISTNNSKQKKITTSSVNDLGTISGGAKRKLEDDEGGMQKKQKIE